MKKTIAMAAVCGMAAAASAGVFSSANNPGGAEHVFGTSPFNGNPNALLTGDTVNAALTVFSAAGGAFAAGPGVHTVGSTSALAGIPGVTADMVITSSVTTVGTTRTLTISMIAANGAAIAAPGLGIGGALVDSIFFELPDLNGGPDLFDDADKVGAASGTFNLLDNTGASLFGTAAGIDDFGTSFSVGNGVTTGPGSDLFGFAPIGGGTWTISYEIVPAPGAAALLAMGGLVAARRRRA